MNLVEVLGVWSLGFRGFHLGILWLAAKAYHVLVQLFIIRFLTLAHKGNAWILLPFHRTRMVRRSEVQGSEFRVWDSGFRVQHLGFRI